MSNQIVELVRPYLHNMSGGHPNIGACCPFHEDPHTSNPSFSINSENGLWQCFGCGLTGNLRSFLRAMGVRSRDLDVVLGPVVAVIREEAKKQQLKFGRRFRRRDPFLAEPVLPEAVLGMYDYLPEQLLAAGFSEDLLNDIEVGFDHKQRRIIFPLRDLYGNLAGVSGRALGALAKSRYKVYEGRERKNGKWHPGDFGSGFDELFPDYHINSKFLLWNADRVWPRLVAANQSTPVVITEGYKACMWVEQQTGLCVTATMGSSMSTSQQDTLLFMTDGPVILMYDGDFAGRAGTRKVGQRLSKCLREVYVVHLPDEYQPDRCDEALLRRLLGEKERYAIWVAKQQR